MSAINEALKSLQEKHDSWIGNRKDKITSANSEGFKDGLAWAIDTIKTAIEQEQFEEKLNREEAEITSFHNKYYGGKGNCGE